MEKYCPKCFKKFDAGLVRCPEDGKKLISLAEKDLVGKELDERYTVISRIGQGGMGTVYVAEQAMIGRKVALKVLRPDVVQDESSVKRFMTEAKAIASLRSPNTITLYDFGVTEQGLLYYTMELLEGSPLAKVIARQGALDHRRAVRIVLQILDSLEEAHEKGILHRDLKPDNVFVSHRREKEHVTVLDFGIAKLLGDTSIETVTRTGMLVGTPQYLSPEQAMGNPAVPESDLYSLAIVLYEMLAGEPPFRDTTAIKVLLRQLNDIPEPVKVKNPNVEVPAALDAFLQRALEKDPSKRFATVQEFRTGLRAAVAEHDRKPETVTLSALAETTTGARIITEPLERKPEAQPTALAERETEIAVSQPEEKAMPPAVAGVSVGSGATTDVVLEPALRSRVWLYVVAGIGAIAAVVALVIWLNSGREQGKPERPPTLPPSAEESVPTRPKQESVPPAAPVMPAPEPPAAEPQQPKLAVEQPKPPPEEPKPPVEQPVPEVEPRMPPVEQPKPAVEQPAPPVEQPKPAVEQPAPPVEQPVPAVEAAAPAPPPPAPQPVEVPKSKPEAKAGKQAKDGKQGKEPKSKAQTGEAKTPASDEEEMGFRPVNIPKE